MHLPRSRRLAALVAVAAATTLAATLIPNDGGASAAVPRTVKVKCAGPAFVKSDGSKWVCTFDDEFAGTELNTASWTAVNTSYAGWHSGPACYTDSPQNVKVTGGHLVLTAVKMPHPFVCTNPKADYTTQYTAGHVTTNNKFSQTYGRFSVRAKFPASAITGLQSSLWLWPDNEDAYGSQWPASGEIDIAEEYSRYADRAIPYVHYDYDKSTVDKLTDLNVVTNNYCMITKVNAFHTYTLVWTPTELQISYDNQLCMIDHWSATNASGSAPFNLPFGVQLTQALGVDTNAFDPATTKLPASTVIDWVRVWK